jgi:hypothetical protein
MVVYNNSAPNMQCNLDFDGAYFECGDIAAETCCQNF